MASKYGVLRSDGVSERSLFVIDKKGIIRYIDVHDINKRPRLEVLVGELQKLEK
jgi:peroxiredoxin (alkyl hydroperoxide reductase subunit C)